MKTRKRNYIPILVLITSFVFLGSNIYSADRLTDKDIAFAVDNELLYNATTPSFLIDVESNEGVVTLSGSVNNILAKDRAIQIAKTVKGVRAVIDKVEVDAPKRSDYTLKKDVEDALLKDPATDSYEVTVMADNGNVTLKGTVDSWQEKQLSAFVAKGVKGVKYLDNKIKIDYREERTDYEIKQDIQQSLKNDIRIDGALVDVSVKNGKVKLSGSVGSANEISIARANAWTSGVTSVSSKNLKISEWARNDKLRDGKYVTKTDIEIKDAVKDALLYDPRVLSFNPDVSVNYGVVTLTGIVDNLKAKRAAEADARNVVGVVRVKNYLKVRPAIILSNAQLENEIENAMLKNPIVETWEVDVTANNGIVYLNGTVDSYFEKIQAEELASKTKGVIAIENNLNIQDNNDRFFYDHYGWNSVYPPYHVDVDYRYQSDETILSNIESQLWWSPYVNEDEVDVVVRDGIAILKGTVDTKREKLFAEINALEGGAKLVDNNIKVNYNK